MKAYFVRKSVNREVVGLFVAPTPVRLAAVVDECCDPGLCDYALARAGGLMVAAETRARWPSASGGTGLRNAVLTQQWEDDLNKSDSGLEWQSLYPATVRMLRALARQADSGASG